LTNGEFLSWQSVAAYMEAGFDFIIANKGCHPSFDPNNWYRPWKRKNIQYNSCVYQPGGWVLPTALWSCAFRTACLLDNFS
jgi:hypothetical protein